MTTRLRTLAEQVREAGLDERIGPVVYCEVCTFARVQWDWRRDKQVCPDCLDVTGGRRAS